MVPVLGGSLASTLSEQAAVGSVVKVIGENSEEPAEVDDVLGGDDAWKNVDKTAATCPKCDHGQAYFMQIQIRSADEPMSTFFKCVKCGNQWREG